MKVRIARDANADLDEIWLFIARRQSVEAAQLVLDRLTDKFYLLARFPKIGRSRPDLREERSQLSRGRLPHLLTARSEGRAADLTRSSRCAG